MQPTQKTTEHVPIFMRLHKCEQQKYSLQLFNLFILSKDSLYLVISTLSKLFNYLKQHGCLTLFWKTKLCPKAFVLMRLTDQDNMRRHHQYTNTYYTLSSAKKALNWVLKREMGKKKDKDFLP